MPDTKKREMGFDYEGRFYPWRVTDMGKDLMLIDRICGIPVGEFFEVIEDDHERTRGPILLTLIATSLRAGNPGWSVERVERAVHNLSLSTDITFLDGDQDDGDVVQLPPETSKPDVAPLTSTASGSSRSSTPEDTSISPTSSVTPM